MSEAKAGARNNIGVPDWMTPFGVKSGEWISMTKAQLRSLMRPDRPLKVQVLACGILHTAGYRGERATTMRRDKIVALTPADIANELHGVAIKHYESAGVEDKRGAFARLRKDKADIRHALVDLERDGLCERRTVDGVPIRTLTEEQSRRLSNGKTEIFFWLKPKPADAEMVRKEWEDRLSDMEAEVERSDLDFSAAPDGATSTEPEGGKYSPLEFLSNRFFSISESITHKKRNYRLRSVENLHSKMLSRELTSRQGKLLSRW